MFIDKAKIFIKAGKGGNGAISFHRDKRSKHQVASELDNIKGIGEKTKSDLLKTFKSVKRIKEADFAELENSIGKNRASIIYIYFHGTLTPREWNKIFFQAYGRVKNDSQRLKNRKMRKWKVIIYISTIFRNALLSFFISCSSQKSDLILSKIH